MDDKLRRALVVGEIREAVEIVVQQRLDTLGIEALDMQAHTLVETFKGVVGVSLTFANLRWKEERHGS